MNILVSIIIPVYNTSKYLDETLQSVVAQTYNLIEIILVDDGSNDNSGLLCDEWAKKDKRIVAYHIDNSGLSCARNYGIKRSHGEYVLCLDSDDYINKEYIEKAVNILDRYADVGIVYCRAELFGDEDGEWILPDFSITEMLIRNCIFVTSLFRKKDWKTVGGFFEEIKYGCEDHDFWLSIIELGRKVYKIPEILFHYRKRKDSITQVFHANSQMVKEHDLLKFYRHRELYCKYYRLLNERKKVILYGAGGAGKTYFNLKETIGNNNICLWVDRDFKNMDSSVQGQTISDPLDIFQVKSDATVIAITDKNCVNVIKEWMVEKGYDRESIFWYLNE